MFSITGTKVHVNTLDHIIIIIWLFLVMGILWSCRRAHCLLQRHGLLTKHSIHYNIYIYIYIWITAALTLSCVYAVTRSTQSSSVEIKMTHSSPQLQLSFYNLGRLSRAGHSAVFSLARHYCNRPCSLLRSWSCTLSLTKMLSEFSWRWAAKTW